MCLCCSQFGGGMSVCVLVGIHICGIQLEVWVHIYWWWETSKLENIYFLHSIWSGSRDELCCRTLSNGKTPNKHSKSTFVPLSRKERKRRRRKKRRCNGFEISFFYHSAGVRLFVYYAVLHSTKFDNSKQTCFGKGTTLWCPLWHIVF